MTEKKLVRVDVSSDTVCPWCFVGKRNLDHAIAKSKDKYNFEIIWHPYQLNPDAPKEGIDKREFFRSKFGSQSDKMETRMTEVFKVVGLAYNLSGLTMAHMHQQEAEYGSGKRVVANSIVGDVPATWGTPLSNLGNTMDSHRLIYFSRQQGLDKQHDLVEELSLGYFTQGKYIGDQKFLLEAAAKVGIEGAEEFLKNPNNGLKEVEDELKAHPENVTGVPYYVINGNQKLSGAQSPEAFLRAFQVATS